jgi:hypothetical protein
VPDIVATSQEVSTNSDQAQVIERMPCTVKLLRVDKGTAAFHDFDEYERLVEVARSKTF